MGSMRVSVEDSWEKDEKKRKWTGWNAELYWNSGNAYYKRSSSAPLPEREYHSNIHHLLSRPHSALKPQPLDISNREYLQASIFDVSKGYSLDRSISSFIITTKKDVDGVQPKMRETSSTEQKAKRKKRQHSSDLISPQSLEDLAVLPSNIENEGVATSCKRIKPNEPQIKKLHYNIFESLSYSKNAAVREAPDDSTSESDIVAVGSDGGAPRQKTMSGDGNTTKSKSDFLARYRTSANSYPDYGPLTSQTAVALPPSKGKMMAGERKAGMPGSFRPVNTLQRNGNSSSILSRPSQKKVFDLHENNPVRGFDEPHAAKRRKVGTENRARRESSVSFIDISADGGHKETARNASSPNSTTKKVVQSVSSRSHYQGAPSGSRLGEVDEYQRTEAIVGFNIRKRRKISDELERRKSFRGEVGIGRQRPRISLISEPSIIETKANPSLFRIGKGKNPILIEDPQQNTVLESSQTQESVDEEKAKSISNLEITKVSMTAKRSPYFVDSKGYGTTSAIISSPASQVTTETPNRENRESSGSFQSLGSGVDEAQDLEDDSVDMVRSDGGAISIDQDVESKVRVKNITIELATISKSESIPQHGDIPQSAFSRLRVKNEQSHTGQALETGLSFEISYMQSGPKVFTSKDDLEGWKLQYIYDKKEFDIIADDFSVREKYPSLVLKPQKIHVVKYNNDSLKVVIGRAMETSIGAASQVLVKMTAAGDGPRFAHSLKSLHSTVRLVETQSEGLDNIFNAARKSVPITSQESKDIALLIVKEARRAEKLNQPPNVGRRRSSTMEQVAPTTRVKQPITSRMQNNSSPDASVLSRSARNFSPSRGELLTKSRLNTQNGRDQYISRAATRASDRQHNEGQSKLPKSRSHSPVGWTTENPRWKEEHSWEASLKFPMEAKKWTKVDAEDIERLDEGGFLNDNLVGFYLRYLQYVLEKDQPELARRVYFQNTYFYSTLVKGKVRSNNINYEAVKRWTTKDKVDIFSYDYIVVPVCEKVHWYVAIICNAPKLLQINTPVSLTPTNIEHTTKISANVIPRTIEKDVDHDYSRTLEKGAIDPKAASLSVISQVEHMSLEDQEWPEPDALPKNTRSAQLQSLQTCEIGSDIHCAGNEAENQGQKGDTRPKTKKSKRKSVPPSRKYDPNEPRIITLDSLGQAHSPTCSNLREYLVCEAQARHNVEIVPGRLGMTAKGLPEQSNFCDCGVFVLGYIQKFLEDPDEFIHNILQGDMTAGKAYVKFNASKMRGEIRELIFRLQADQLREGNARHELNPEPPETSSIKTQSRVSSNVLDNKSSEEAKMEPSSHNSTSAEAVLQSNSRPVASENGLTKRSKLLDIRRPWPSAMKGENGDQVKEAEGAQSESIDMSTAMGATNFHKPAGTSTTRKDESEIMETPIPSEEDEPTLGREYNSRDSSIPLESPLHSDMMESDWGKSPGCIEDVDLTSGSRTYNVFKEFAKNRDLPFQNTRNKSRHYTIKLSDSQDERLLEVRETPPRKIQHEVEEARESYSGSHGSNAIILDHDDNSDPEVVSTFKSATRSGRSRH